MTKKYEKAIKNSLISVILGDMIGTPVQFMSKEELQEELKYCSINELIEKGTNTNVPFGFWSDDSSMTLCTVSSIAEKETIDLDNIVKQFVEWLNNGYLTPGGKTFDAGNITIKSLNKYIYADGTIKNNIKPEGLNHIYSNGNGSLMRILPVSIYCYFKKLSKQETFETVKNVSSITHAHPISVLGCYIYTLIVFEILNGKSKKEIIINLKNIYKKIPAKYTEWLEKYDSVINGSIIEQNKDNLNSSGYVKDTLEVALWGFYNTDSVEDCIFKIIELGDDTDTNAAVGGGLSGLYYGLKGIFAKQYWVDKIAKKDIICDLLDKYIKSFI